MRSRNYDELNAPVEAINLSCVLFHAANVSYRIGEAFKAKKVEKAIKDSALCTEAFNRFQEHLVANNVDLSKKSSAPLTMGPWLTFDGDKEQFVGEFSEDANAYVSRPPREPFAIPEKV